MNRCLSAMAGVLVLGSVCGAMWLPSENEHEAAQLQNANPGDSTARSEKAQITEIVRLCDVLDSSALAASENQAIERALPALYEAQRAARVRRDEEDNATSSKTVLAQYRQHGQHDLKWDAIVEAAFSEMAKNGMSAKVADQCKAAMDAGCTDPFVAYWAARKPTNDPEEKQALTLMLNKAATDLENTDYPADRKFYAYLRTLEQVASEGSPPEIMQWRKLEIFAKALQLYPDSAKVKPLRIFQKEGADHIAWAAYRLFTPRKWAFDQFYPIIEKALPDNAIALYLKAEFYKDYAWDARGNGYANTVTPDGWKLFAERLATAAEAAKKAWRLDPLDDRSACLMITICMGQSEPRQEMEKWFRRATLAQPDSYDAYLKKMNYLFPKWHGSPDEMRVFAQECLKVGTIKNRIGLISTLAHDELAKLAPDPENYWLQPAVWKDLNAAYQSVRPDKDRLATDRNVLRERARYLEAAYKCQQWEVAHQLLEEFKSDLDIQYLGRANFANYKTRIELQYRRGLRK